MGLINKLFGLIKTTNSSEKQIIRQTDATPASVFCVVSGLFICL